MGIKAFLRTKVYLTLFMHLANFINILKINNLWKQSTPAF